MNHPTTVLVAPTAPACGAPHEAHYPTYPAPWDPPKPRYPKMKPRHFPDDPEDEHPPRVSPEMLIAQLEARIVLLEVEVRRLERIGRLANLTYGGIKKAGV